MGTDCLRKGSARRIPSSPSNLQVIFVIYTLWHSYCFRFLAAHETFFARPGFHTRAYSVLPMGGLGTSVFQRRQ